MGEYRLENAWRLDQVITPPSIGAFFPKWSISGPTVSDTSSIARFIAKKRPPACARLNPICVPTSGSTAPSRAMTMPKMKMPA